jgi:hypothetical protein
VEFSSGIGSGARLAPNRSNAATQLLAEETMPFDLRSPKCRTRRDATFVELLSPGAAGYSGCTIEMENAQGGKMKIQVQGLGNLDLAVLSGSFWKKAS